VAQAFSSAVTALRAERDRVVLAKQAALAAYDALARDWRGNRALLASTYNVDLPQSSILENRKALELLGKRPENRSTEWAIRAFLAFIFTGLLLLKLFEPGSVRLYLSDVLQQEYSRYLAGTFDPMLPDTERSTANRSAMSPQRLYDFLSRIWIPARRLEAEQAESRARALHTTESLRVLEDIRARIDADLRQAQAAREWARSEMDKAKANVDESVQAIALVRADIELFHSQLSQPAPAPDSALDDQGLWEFEQSRLALQSRTRQRLSHAQLVLSDLQKGHGPLAQTLERADRLHRDWEQCFVARQTEYTQADLRIQEVRRRAGEAAERLSLLASGVSNEGVAA
jgi:hypothetical protein